MESITSYNGVDFTNFLKNMNLLYEDASEAYLKGDSLNGQELLTMAFGMKSAFLCMFGDNLDIVRTGKITEYIIVER